MILGLIIWDKTKQSKQWKQTDYPSQKKGMSSVLFPGTFHRPRPI